MTRSLRKDGAESYLGRRASLGFTGAAIAVAVSLSPATVVTHDPVSSVSWTRDIEPITRARCLSCHQPGGAALPTLASYEDYRQHRAAVKTAVLSGQMPIWSPRRGFGAFKADRSLSPLQVSLIASWIEAGAPVKAGSDSNTESSTPSTSDAFSRGSVERIELLPFTSREPVQRQTLDLPTSPKRAITGWRFRPADPTIRSLRVFDDEGRLLWTAFPDSLDERYPTGVGIGVHPSGRLVVELTRRTHDADGTFRAPKKSVSLLEIEFAQGPSVELQMVEAACGGGLQMTGTIYGARPSLSEGASMEIRRVGQASSVVGLFGFSHSDFQPTYWFRDPLRVGRGERLAIDGSQCTVTLFVAR